MSDTARKAILDNLDYIITAALFLIQKAITLSLALKDEGYEVPSIEKIEQLTEQIAALEKLATKREE